jgi:arylsulfatase A-like enzyme
MVMGCDWYPTLAQLCEAKLPETKIDGKSITTVIKSADAKTPHEHLYWQLGKGPRAQWVVREGDWKLLGNPQDRSKQGELDPKKDKHFLANLSKDLSETTNVASEETAVVERLQKIRQSYAELNR